MTGGVAVLIKVGRPIFEVIQLRVRLAISATQAEDGQTVTVGFRTMADQLLHTYSIIQ